MRKIATATLFAFLFAAGGHLCAAPSFNSPITSLPKISIALPAEAVVTDDLDARDEFNRPIRDSVVHRQFESLWRSSLNQVILESLTPARVRTLLLLSKTWDRFAGMFRIPFRRAVQSVREWSIFNRFNFSRRVVSSLRLSALQSEHPLRSAGNSFSFLIHLVISSTRLLR